MPGAERLEAGFEGPRRRTAGGFGPVAEVGQAPPLAKAGDQRRALRAAAEMVEERRPPRGVEPVVDEVEPGVLPGTGARARGGIAHGPVRPVSRRVITSRIIRCTFARAT